MDGVAILYDLTPTKPVRVLLGYGGGPRPLFWFEVGKDASVYAGLSRAAVSVSRGEVSTNQGQARIGYADGQPVTDAAVLKKLHLSFHSSGAINATGLRSYRSSWRDNLVQGHQLCLIVFDHPSRFPLVPHVRKRDIVVEFPVDEKKPLQGNLFVGPKGKVIEVAKLETQVSLVFEISKLDRLSEMNVQFTLGQGVEGPWPPHTSVAWAAAKPTDRA